MPYGAGPYGVTPYAGGVFGGVLLPPTLTLDAIGATTATVSWVAVDDATGYKVRVDGGSETDIGNVLTYDFTGLTPSTTQTLEVQAYNDEDESLWSGIEATTIDHFEVSVDGGDPVFVTDLCEFIGGLTPGTITEVCVRSCSETCCSEYVCINVGTCPGLPSNLTFTSTNSSVTVCWDPPETGGFDYYEIRINGGDPVEATSCYQYTGLDDGTTYDIQVRACNESCCGEWTSINATTTAGASTCACGVKWRVEACDLATGRVRAILNPISIDVQTVANGIGTGTLTFNIKDVRLRDIWPGLTSIYITYDGFPVGGFITQKPHAENGTLQVGLKSIESYLERRVLDVDRTYTSVQQTVIAQSLVAQAISDGIPLTGLTLPSTIQRDRSYLAADLTYIWRLLEDLFNSSSGPDYTLMHTKTGGYWSTQILFEDESGRQSGLVLIGDVHGTYGLDVDSVDLTNYVFAKGGSGLLAISDGTASSPYPRFDSVQSFDSVNDLPTLQEQADGWEEGHNQPYAVPGFVIVGDDPHVSLLGLHDTARFRFSQGAATFDGDAKVTGITWTASPDQPLNRALSLEPVQSVIDTVMNAVPTEPCPDC